MRRIVGLTALMMLSGVTVPALAGPPSERFTLGRYMPGDVWMYIHSVHNPERQWLEKEWAEFFEALKTSGIDRDVAGLVLGSLEQQQRSETEASIEKWTRLLQHVPWSDIVSAEVAYGQRVASVPGAYDYFVLTNSRKGAGEKNAAALVKILRELAALCDEIHVVHEQQDGIDVWSMTSGDRGIKNLGFSLELIRKGDVIGLTTNPGPRREILALMTGKAGVKSILRSPRFQEAVSQVAPAEDFVSFVDARRIIRDLRGLFDRAEHGGAQGLNNKENKVASAVAKALEHLDVLDYAVTTVETQDRRELRHEVTKLQTSKANCAVACCGLDRKPFTRFDQFVPVDARGFKLSGSIHLKKAYDFATVFVAEELPDGAEYIEKWRGWLSSLGFDPQRDLFSWWSGEMISISLPRSMVTPFGGGEDWVLLIRVKDAAVAREKIDGLLTFASGLTQGQGQMLTVSPAKVDAEGFRQVVHPMLAMAVRPVVGMKGDWLMVGSSPIAVNKCLAVESGKAPSIAKNERFAREGLVPKGPVLSASFTDTSDYGEKMGAEVGMAGMLGAMATGMIQGEEAAPFRDVFQKMMGVVTKLGPVVRTLDFYSSEAAITTYDGKSIVRTERVVTYKPPKGDDSKTAQAP